MSHPVPPTDNYPLDKWYLPPPTGMYGRTGDDVAQIVRRGDQEERLSTVQAIDISVAELAATGTRLTPELLRLLQTLQLHDITVACVIMINDHVHMINYPKETKRITAGKKHNNLVSICMTLRDPPSQA